MRNACLSAVLLLFAAPALAQDQTPPRTTPRFDVFVGLRAPVAVDDSKPLTVPERANGVTVSFAWNVTPVLAVVVDNPRFGVSRSDLSGTHVEYCLVAGPRLRFVDARRLSPFAQALVGAVHGSFGPWMGGPVETQTFAQVALGGGLDWRFREHVGLRLFQVDVGRTLGGPAPRTTTTVSFGLLLRFGGRAEGNRR
jgi:hypothetical protein